ncbi:MAG: LPS-assembly protein LptD [Burkholderiaceae bacterium]|nr:LPS-assembly protein LptD [Burkholderiaceae bacterium]
MSRRIGRLVQAASKRLPHRHPLALALAAGLLVSLGWLPNDARGADGDAPPTGKGFVLRLAPRLEIPDEAQRSGASVYAIGDRVQTDSGKVTVLQGHAELRSPGTVVRADRIEYDHAVDQVTATGKVRVFREGTRFVGDRLTLQLDRDQGSFQSPIYEIPAFGGRGRASRVDFLGPKRVLLKEATYSTCEPQPPDGHLDWYLRAESLQLDQENGEGWGRSASVYFKGLKVLAVPAFAFPLGDQRRSGFLAPSIGVSSTTGLDVVTPYYWNIAPNRDLTIYPRVMTRRGLQIGADYRFLDRAYRGETRVEWTPWDRKTGGGRHFYSLRNQILDLGGWQGLLNIKGVSDDNYFVDFSRTIVATSERSLPRDILFTRGVGDWTLLARASTWQNILDARDAPPYERLPQLQAQHLALDRAGGLDFDTLFDVTSFTRPLANSPEGIRAFVNPKVSFPVRRAGWFVVPAASLHATTYSLTTNPAGATTLNRVVPTGSLDAGLIFERKTRLLGRDAIQTLEPRLFYARSAYRDQSQFPVFDSGTADFNFAQLFSTNTFVGNDRIADVHQLTTALVSRVIDPNDGAQRFRGAIGQRTYFSRQRVTLPGGTAPTDRRSDILLAASAELGNGHSFDAGLQYSVRDSRLPRGNFQWRYHASDGRILNVGVRHVHQELGQIDTSWRWPIAPRWTSLGRLNYSWLRSTIDPVTLTVVPAQRGVIESVFGFEYRQDCWTTRFVVQRYIAAPSNVTTTGLFLQLELRGVGRVGPNPFDILRRNIPGYRLPQDLSVPPSRFFEYE